MHILFNGWIIFHCVYVLQLSYPFVCQWTSRLLPCPGYYKQSCDEHWSTWVSFLPYDPAIPLLGVHVFPILNPPPSPSDTSAPVLSTLSHAFNLDWRSVSHMIIYMFQCYSLKSSHPHLLPQSPKVCSTYLCLFFCFAYRVIINIFLNSIYMC